VQQVVGVKLVAAGEDGGHRSMMIGDADRSARGGDPLSRECDANARGNSIDEGDRSRGCVA
jgi:hypothetical protein